MNQEKTKILIVEKSEIIREGLSSLLTDKTNHSFDIETCGDCNELQYYFHKKAPQVLVVSPALFELNEKQIKEIKDKYQTLFVGLIYAFHQPENLKFFDALIHLNDTKKQIQNTINALIQTADSNNQTASEEILTTREKEILKLLVNGNTTKQIATTLHISAHTVNAHRKNIMRKLDIKTVSGLTIYAVLNNIITLKEV